MLEGLEASELLTPRELYTGVLQLLAPHARLDEVRLGVYLFPCGFRSGFLLPC